ncbi:MAG: hypothetical protein CVV51_01040 [Spirochaetae bacterium HGW-Spirochaetae-7]|nr:MAG: hypothetical protein CVV51_01040 [Spirochaetae bacterium HGW-Spirochaetae-7]
MKRFLAVLVILFAATFAFAQGKGFEPLMAPGDLAVSAGVGYGFFYGAVDVSGGVELMLGKFMLGDTLPLTYGVAGKASYYKYNYGGWGGGDYYYSFLGAGGFGTLHLGLKAADLPDGLEFMNNTDWYIGVGAGFYSYHYSYYSDYNEFRVGLRTVGGVNYFLTPNFAINVEGGYYGGWGGGLIGVTFKL